MLISLRLFCFFQKFLFANKISAKAAEHLCKYSEQPRKGLSRCIVAFLFVSFQHLQIKITPTGACQRRRFLCFTCCVLHDIKTNLMTCSLQAKTSKFKQNFCSIDTNSQQLNEVFKEINAQQKNAREYKKESKILEA